jgi:hypothetical protein
VACKNKIGGVKRNLRGKLRADEKKPETAVAVSGSVTSEGLGSAPRKIDAQQKAVNFGSEPYWSPAAFRRCLFAWEIRVKTLYEALYGSEREVQHDLLVRRAAQRLAGFGCTDVRADVVGYPTPEPIHWVNTGQGHRPDVTGGLYVIEVETGDSLSSEHTRSQCELFSTFAREQSRTFVVGVPLGNKLDMQVQLIVWGIAATVWEL